MDMKGLAYFATHGEALRGVSSEEALADGLDVLGDARGDFIHPPRCHLVNAHEGPVVVVPAEWRLAREGLNEDRPEGKQVGAPVE